jgi:acetoin utilization protein AcuB
VRNNNGEETPMLMPPVSRFMTTGAHVVEATSTIANARRLMQSHAMHHVPVIDRGKLVGMVSERDLWLLQASARIDPNAEQVREAMMQDAVTVAGATPLDEVAELMVGRHATSVVVTEGPAIVGIFTVTDALVALAEVLKRAAA